MLDSESTEEEELNKAKHRRRLIKLYAISFAAIVMISVLVRIFGGIYTGYVSAVSNSLQINEMAYKNSKFLLSSDSDIQLSAAKLSGKVMGNGSVNIYLQTEQDTYLIYSNNVTPKFPSITGFAVKKVTEEINKEIVEGSYLSVKLDKISLTGENNILSGITLKCENHEAGMYLESMKVSWGPDKGEAIKGVKLNGIEFWGYDKAGKTPTPQLSGSQLFGWGQNLPEDTTRVMNEIAFDSDMAEKEIYIELYYRDYLPGFRLGDQKTVKIFIDLSGKKESYVDSANMSRVIYIVEEQEKDPTTVSGPEHEDQNVTQQAQLTQAATIEEFVEEFEEEGIEQEDGSVLTSEGFLLRSRDINESDFTLEDFNGSIMLRIIEDPEFREIFEKTLIKEEDIKEISHACTDTCIMDILNKKGYKIIFEVDPGTAVDITTIEFS